MARRTRTYSMNDPLGVLTSCRAVVESSDWVRIDPEGIEKVAAELISSQEAPGWDADLHYRATGPDGDERTAMWLFVLDALNFCFWGQGEDPNQRWRIRWNGELVDGYVALVAALTTAMERGYPLHDSNWLATVSDEDVADILAPAEGHTKIPLFQTRVSNLRELGRGLSPYGETPASSFIQKAHGSAVCLVQNIVRSFPSFNDVTIWPYSGTGLPGNEVRFYKRAQILVGDLAGGLSGSELVQFHDLNQLTAFADYKVPQILREMGILIYEEELASTVNSRTKIAAGSRLEVEIRAGTIIACDRLVTALRASGREITAAELDWHLWSLSQSLGEKSRPYHLTKTIYY